MTGVAAAGDDTFEPTRAQIAKLPATKQKIALLRHYLLHAAEAKLGPAGRAAAKRKRGKAVRLSYATAVDGDNVYFARVTISPGTELDEELKLPTQLVRRDRATGKETILMQSSTSLLISVFARAGRVAASTIQVSAGDSDTEVATTLITGDAASDKLVVSDTQKIKIDGESICGDAALLTGMADDGEAVLSTMHASCGDLPLFATQVVGVRDAATRRVLMSGGYGPFGSPADLESGRLLTANPYEPALGVADVSSGKFTNLWSPGARARDIASDGTVALIGLPAERETYTEYWPGERRPPRKVIKHPFIVFPQGDGERPIVASASAGKIASLHYCGANLYALKEVPEKRKRHEDSFDALGDVDFGFAGSTRVKLRVLLYTREGGFVRELAKTPPLQPRSFDCSGDRLDIVSVRGENVSVLEYGP